MRNEKEELEELRSVDPAAQDAPPEKGSARYLEIKERSMPTTTTTATQPRPQTRRRLTFAAALAAVAAVIAVAGSVNFNEQASAAEVITAAAVATGDQTSLRAELVVEQSGESQTTTAAATGRDIQVISPEVTTTIVGDRAVEQYDGEKPRTSRVEPGEGLAPFASSSEAVVLAALKGNGVTELGNESVRGQDATHYRIDLDQPAKDRLSELSPGQLAWFELESPNNAVQLDVWVSDELIRRVRVVSEFGPGEPSEVTTTEFYDFGADIDISLPKTG